MPCILYFLSKVITSVYLAKSLSIMSKTFRYFLYFYVLRFILEQQQKLQYLLKSFCQSRATGISNATFAFFPLYDSTNILFANIPLTLSCANPLTKSPNISYKISSRPPISPKYSNKS